jgi:3-oxoacyl-[acyl-carrier protein] reductase
MTSTLPSPAPAAEPIAAPGVLTDKTVLVTGASRGIGRAIAVACARAGADVVVNYARSADEAAQVVDEVRSLGRRAEAVACDVSDLDSVQTMMKRAVGEFGRVDVLVNNAGVLLRGFLMMVPAADFASVLQTNTIGTFHCIKAVSRYMVQRRSGCIVNVSSLAGFRGLMGQGAYAASKAAVNSLTALAAKELAKYNIRVNAVAPGCIDAGMMKDFSDETRESYVGQIPMKRYGRAEEVAQAVIFLASDASSYITGHVLPVDGGMLIG